MARQRHSAKAMLLGLVPLLAGCGPSMTDIGRDVLVSAPVMLAAGGLLMLPFWLWWRRTRPGLHFDLRPALGLAIPLVLVALGTLPFLDKDARSWLMSVLVFSGSGYLCVALLTWRVWMSVDPERACSWALLPPMVLWLLPAIPLALGVTKSDEHPLAMAGMLIWLWLGSVGMVPGLTLGLVVLALIIEAAVRGRKRTGLAATPLESGPLDPPRVEEAHAQQEGR